MRSILLIIVAFALPCDALRAQSGGSVQRSNLGASNVRHVGLRHMGPLMFTPPKRNDVDSKDDTSLDMSDAVSTGSKDGGAELTAIQRVLDFYKEYSTRESVNGFTDISELINGRLAMIGLIAGYTKEYFTGETLLQQVGIGSPKWEGFGEISQDIGIAALVTFFVVTISIFNMRPPSENEIEKF